MLTKSSLFPPRPAFEWKPFVLRLTRSWRMMMLVKKSAVMGPRPWAMLNSQCHQLLSDIPR